MHSGHNIVHVRPVGGSLARACAAACLILPGLGCSSHAGGAQPPPTSAPAAACLPSGDGYVRARISGALDAELSWGNEGTECTGAVRPTDGGIRMRFSRVDLGDDGAKLVLVFGIAKLREGQPAKLVPVNVTVMREGKGEFYSTQGDDKCMLDDVQQQPIVGIPNRSRSYRVVARGFCTEPARAVRGKGAVLLSRFDIAGRVDFGSEDDSSDESLAVISR
ncbi:MAG: hypothetical protein ACREV5_14260 [Steroidobacter sp.]